VYTLQATGRRNCRADRLRRRSPRVYTALGLSLISTVRPAYATAMLIACSAPLPGRADG